MPLDRPGLDRYPAAPEVRDRVGNGSIPFEAQIAVPRLDRQARHFGRMHAWSMQIELRRAEAVCPSLPAANEFGAQHVAIEGVRALPVGDMHDAVIESDRQP